MKLFLFMFVAYLSTVYLSSKAFDELERSINLNPNDSNLFEMAEFMLQDDKRDEAIRYLRKGSNHFVVFIHLRIGPELRNLFKDKASKYIQIPQHSIWNSVFYWLIYWSIRKIRWKLKIQMQQQHVSVWHVELNLKAWSYWVAYFNWLRNGDFVSGQSQSSWTVPVPISRNHYQSDESIRHYREYFSVNPTSFELWNNLGLLSHQKHKKLASIACFRRAVYLNPIDSVAWLNLALLYLHNGQLISALNAINSTLALSRDSMAFDVFGLVLMLLGQERVHRQTLSVIENVRETL